DTRSHFFPASWSSPSPTSSSKTSSRKTQPQRHKVSKIARTQRHEDTEIRRERIVAGREFTLKKLQKQKLKQVGESLLLLLFWEFFQSKVRHWRTGRQQLQLSVSDLSVSVSPCSKTWWLGVFLANSFSGRRSCGEGSAERSRPSILLRSSA